MPNDNNNNLGFIIFKIVALAGGVLTGAIAANWLDKRMSNMAHEKSDYDKTYYAQGLAPREASAPTIKSVQSEQPRIIRVEQPEYQNWTVEDADEER